MSEEMFFFPVITLIVTMILVWFKGCFIREEATLRHALTRYVPVGAMTWFTYFYVF